jgi:hypothetical protein
MDRLITELSTVWVDEAGKPAGISRLRYFLQAAHEPGVTEAALPQPLDTFAAT